MATYDIGNQIRVTGTFTNPLSDDVPIDPSFVRCGVRPPTTSTVEYQYGVDSEIIKSGTGVYYIDVPLTKKGFWYIRWSGLDSGGDASSAEEVQIKCAAHKAV